MHLQTARLQMQMNRSDIQTSHLHIRSMKWLAAPARVSARSPCASRKQRSKPLVLTTEKRLVSQGGNEPFFWPASPRHRPSRRWPDAENSQLVQPVPRIAPLYRAARAVGAAAETRAKLSAAAGAAEPGPESGGLAHHRLRAGLPLELLFGGGYDFE